MISRSAVYRRVVLFVDTLIKVKEKKKEMKNIEERNKSKTYKSTIDA